MTNPPPLTIWGHVWRMACVVAISGIAWAQLARWQWDNQRWWFWLDLALGLISILVVLYRRRYPVLVAVTVTVFSAVSAASGGPALLALFSLATRRRLIEIIPIAGLSVIAGQIIAVQDPTGEDSAALTFIVLILLVGIMVAWGMYVGSRRELLDSLRERARRAEAEQSARIRQARTAERTQIAREMHDVLAHRISMVAMHAGALSYRDDLSAEQVKESVKIIQQSSTQALTELRQVLGVLRDGPGDAQPEPPQPSGADIATLIEECQRLGMNVRADLDGLVADVPDEVGRTAYRIVQEALTNARKHAPNTLVTVTLSGGPADGVSIDVTNLTRVGSPVGVPSSGLGLIGLRERAELAGGTLQVSSGRQSFSLQAWLPWPT